MTASKVLSVRDSCLMHSKFLSMQLHSELEPLRKFSDDTQALSVTSAPVVLHVAQNPTDAWVRELLSTGSMEYHKVRMPSMAMPPGWVFRAEEIIRFPLQIVSMLRKSSAVEEAKELCSVHGSKALQALDVFAESEAKTALQNIVKAVTAVG